MTMGTLDRSIARQFLFNIVALLVLLFCFVVAVDVVLNIDRFLKAADRLSTSGGQPPAQGVRRFAIAALLVVDLWWPRLLQLFTFMIGMVLVAAMGFTLAQMVRHRELVAILAGGMSLRRVARPILIVAAAVLALRAANQEFVLPRIAPLLSRDAGDAGGGRQRDRFGVLPTPDASRRLWFAESFDPSTNVLQGVTIWERDATGHTTRRIEAARATWRPGESAKNGGGAGSGSAGWSLEGATARAAGLAPAGQSRAAADAPLAPPGQAARIDSDLDPIAIMIQRSQDRGFSQSLSWSQITRMLRSDRLTPAVRQTLEQVRWGRVSTAFSTLLTLVISMPFFLTREPRNMLVQSLKCAPVGLTALIGGVIGAAAPVPGLPVWLGVMLPVLVLIPVAVAMISGLKT